MAIVGAGPRGLYCLERLVAHFSAAPLDAGLDIAVFNRSPQFGASGIYDPHQPEYLLVNMKVGEIDVWGTDSPAGVVVGALDFISWYAQSYPSRAALTGEEYLGRSVVGRYLVEAFQRIVDEAPSGVSVSRHVGEVVDIEPARGDHVVVAVGASGGRLAVSVDNVILATGHAWPEPQTAAPRRPGQRPRAPFIPFVYPVNERLADVAAGTSVAMLGLGLTFIDAALALTEGRGGAFARDAGGTLVYSSSGQEPSRILPFSRTGLPMSPKSADLPLEPSELRFLRPETLRQCLGVGPAGKLDLERDVWPLVELEMDLAYYGVALAGQPGWEGSDAADGTPAGVRRAIDACLDARPDVARFDYKAILDPAAARHFATAADFDRFVGAYMAEQITLARLGQTASAMKAAIDVWYAARTALGSLMQYGGFTPQAHKRLVELIFPALRRVAFGPPIVNIEKLAALRSAGLMDFSMARGSVASPDDAGAGYELRSPHFGGDAVSVASLVDARYPEVDVAEDVTPLWRALRRRGTIRAFENRPASPGQPSYWPGAIDMTDPHRHVLGVNGMSNRNIAVIGIPTEGNLVGNLTMARDSFANRWAGEVVGHFHCIEAAAAAAAPSSTDAVPAGVATAAQRAARQ